MPVLIETPRPNRFKTMEKAVAGSVEKEVLDILHKTGKTGKPVKPKGKYKVTSTGRHRKPIYNNLVIKKWAKARYYKRLGGNVYSITPLGEQARLNATVAKAPPSGYRKVRRGRPAKAKANGRAKAA